MLSASNLPQIPGISKIPGIWSLLGRVLKLAKRVVF
jgi:hypothetical protein